MIKYDALVVDIDGVVWIDGEPIRENIEALSRIAETGVEVLLLTNNSTRSRRAYSRRLSSIGLHIGPDRVVNSGYSASLWLLEKRGPAKVLAVGEEGLVEELMLQGHEPLNPGDYEYAEAVVVGLDRGLSYRKLEAAAWAIRRGALFIATNRDNAYPTPGGLSPGAGSIVSLLETATGRSVDIDAGKPSPWILEAALKLLGRKPERLAIIGDRVDTDMELARRAGVDGILVMTGVAASRGDKVPKWVKTVRTLKDLL
ncbi:MAG: HAD-IIA family hydrolase [Desulfurococcales archaeon]|nr:HAD-IIA family hydrolase [Desulfurococcales archaeon]MCE4605321.1 HAD-IIA family hydrolase [Desulfurococcales archaeon]